jgi:hypothetical protein
MASDLESINKEKSLLWGRKGLPALEPGLLFEA